jgi:hypothetical protein
MDGERASVSPSRRGRAVAVLEEVGADRLRECGIVELDRDEIAGLVAGALPARADLRAFLAPGMNAVVRRVLGFARFCHNDGDLGVEAERADAPGIAGLQLRELSNLCHAELLSFLLR